MTFESTNFPTKGARIKVIGVGGGGTNAVNTMIRNNIEGVDFICMNTDVQSLRSSLAPYKIQIGKELTKGLGAGADPDIGRDAALEDRHEIHEALVGADMVFITAGMGGGTGTGGASIAAQIAREIGALTVAVVTKPFLFEGKRRRIHADLGIERLRETVDTLIMIPNQRLLQIATPDLSMMQAFNIADDVLVNAVRGISDIINIPGTINVDFADVKTVMSSMGQALMGIGKASGPNRAIEAANQAISSPLLEDIDIEGASGILINITAGENVSLLEVNAACSIIQEAAHEDANIIFGAVIDPNMEDEIQVTVIATGFPNDRNESLVHTPHQSTMQHSYSKSLSLSKNTYTHAPVKHPSMGRDPIKEKPTPVWQNKEPKEPVEERSFKKQVPEFSHSQNSSYLDKQSDFPSKKPEPKTDDSLEKFDLLTNDVLGDHLGSAHSLSLEIDKRIDEALDLADRIKNTSHFDDIEIPTFLRQNPHDIAPQ
ncbi:MAG: cell division protein FtsZ [Oligoflexales bacterium]|nr:cell division protein FtsZ [Oligoflexales bacterium]